MTIVDKAWVKLCAMVLIAGTSWCAGYYSADQAWTQRDTKRKLTDAEASEKLSEEYRIKEQKLNENIGEIETKAINDAAVAEMEYKAVIDRLRNAGAHPSDGLRVKSSLTCRSVSGSASTSGSGHEEIQSGLSAEVAGDAIGIGAECDQVVVALDACQGYVESIRKPLD